MRLKTEYQAIPMPEQVFSDTTHPHWCSGVNIFKFYGAAVALAPNLRVLMQRDCNSQAHIQSRPKPAAQHVSGCARQTWAKSLVSILFFCCQFMLL
jgi:hypothetical protein